MTLPLPACLSTLSTISFAGWIAVAQVPVVRIDALAHDQIAHFLSERELRHFLRILRLMIDAVGGTEEDSFDVECAFDQPLGQIQLPADLCV